MADTGKRRRRYEQLLLDLSAAQAMQGGSPVTITYWASVADVDCNVARRAAHALSRMGLVTTGYRTGHLTVGMRRNQQAVFVFNDDLVGTTATGR